MTKPKSQSPYPSYQINVDYDQPLKKMIVSGNYNWVDSDITNKHFPQNKKGKEQADIFIISIDHRMYDLEVTQFLDSLGLRDANIKELLSLGAQFPDLQCKKPIVARSTSWRDSIGFVDVPCLDNDEWGRNLRLIYLGGHWLMNWWQFAAVKK